MGTIQRAKITILDLSDAGSTGKFLVDVLTGSSHKNEQLRFEVRLIHSSPAKEEYIQQILADDLADIVFLMLPHELQSHSANILRLLKVTLGISTVIVVSETQEPNEMFDLLRQGADEFLPFPIEIVNALPRLWRLLEHSSQKMVPQQKMRSQFGLRQLIGQSAVWIEQIDKIPL